MKKASKKPTAPPKKAAPKQGGWDTAWVSITLESYETGGARRSSIGRGFTVGLSRIGEGTTDEETIVRAIERAARAHVRDMLAARNPNISGKHEYEVDLSKLKRAAEQRAKV